LLKDQLIHNDRYFSIKKKDFLRLRGWLAGTQFQNTAIGIEGKNLIGHYGFSGDKVNYAEDFW
jgi:hypothetical protein